MLTAYMIKDSGDWVLDDLYVIDTDLLIGILLLQRLLHLDCTIHISKRRTRRIYGPGKY